MQQTLVQEETQECPVLRALTDDPHIQLVEDEHVPFAMAELEWQGKRYFFTPHSIERFMERADSTVHTLFPHLDFEDPLHALFAMVVMFRAGKLGRLKNCKREGNGNLSSGWLFPIAKNEGASLYTIVTSFPKRKTTRFYC